MDIVEETQKNIEALKAKIGPVFKCPICHHEKFAVLHGTFRHDVQTQPDAFTFGGPGITAMVLICSYCGFISQHAVSILRDMENPVITNASKTD